MAPVRFLVSCLFLPCKALLRLYQCVSGDVGQNQPGRCCFRSTAPNSTCRRYVLVSLLLLVLVPFMFYKLTFKVGYRFRNDHLDSACVIPELDPFDKSVMQFVWTPEPLVCDSKPTLLYVDKNGQVQYNSSALTFYGVQAESVRCHFSVIQRYLDDDHVIFTKPKELKPPMYVSADFFNVSCLNSQSKLFYDDILTNVHPSVTNDSKLVKPEDPDHPSVLMFGLDSVSRSTAIRKIPKTFEFLTKELGVFDFTGYMTVGENTLPNLTPLLTGKRAWTNELPVKDYSTEFFDKFPLIWQNFSRENYATLYVEDMPEFATFNYLTKGFQNPPTDHYMRPYYMGVQAIHEIKTLLNPVFLFLESQSVKVQKASTLCQGNTPKHKIVIKYLKQFIQRYRGLRKFLFSFLVEISHEYPNFLSYADEDFLEFLKWMKEEGDLKNSVLVFFSDHGARIDRIRNTFVGRIEEKMPLVLLYLPDHIRKQYPQAVKNIQINTKRLATAFDMHQTLGDILHKNFENATTQYMENRRRGMSLFQPIPEDRSCADAWIPENYCACYRSESVNISSNEAVRKAAEAVVKHLNMKLKSQPLCAQLSLYKIQEAQRILEGLKHTHTDNKGVSLYQFFKPEEKFSQRYVIIIETVPGNGIFDATVDVRGASDFHVVGDVVRANKYGDQPRCISDKRLRPLCYCY